MSKTSQSSRGPQRTGALPLYDRLERFVTRRSSFVIGGAAVVGLLLAIALFDVKLGTGGDDTVYILQAHQLLSKGELPVGFKSPGYPIVLALFMLATGVNVMLLKLTSLIFFVAAVLSFGFVFRRRMNAVPFHAGIVLFATSLLVLEYAHQTYSEMLFLLLELWTFHVLWNYEEKPRTVWTPFPVAAVAMSGFFVRAIGATLPISIAVYLAVKKQWKSSAIFSFWCIVLYAPLKIVEWTKGIAVIGQAKAIFLVNPYNPLQGNETVAGLGERVVNNLVNHLNYMFPRALSLFSSPDLAPADGRFLPNGAALAGLLISFLLLWGLVSLWKRPERGLASMTVYLFVYVMFICFSLQNLFATDRMMVPVVPLLIIGLFEGIERCASRLAGARDTLNTGAKRWIVLAVVLWVGASVAEVQRAVSENLPVLRQNLRGNRFYGYTDDWVNYLTASEWVGKSLPRQTTKVICRKPELFQIYTGGYEAFGVYQVDQVDPDSIVATWRRSHATHLLYDNFQWTGTLRRYVQPVLQKYPRLFTLVHQEGTAAPSYVFVLQYDSVAHVARKE